LSKAYSQHSLGGYNLPAPRQSTPSAYPSLQSAPPNNAGPAENFYTGEQQHDYGRQTPQQSYAPQPSHPASQLAFSSYDKRASISGPVASQYPPQQPQRSDSWRNSIASPPQYGQQPSYPPNEMSPPHAAGAGGPQQGRLPSQPPQAEPAAIAPTSDPSAAFYFNQTPAQGQQTPSAPSEPMQSPYPTLRQPAPYQPSLPQPPAAVPAQPAQAVPAQQQPAQPGPQQVQQPQAPYWSHPAAQHQAVPAPAQPAPQPQWPQAPNAGYQNYSQEAFPSAPHHALQQPVVEESLIEL